jgi:hypothetical protein
LLGALSRKTNASRRRRNLKRYLSDSKEPEKLAEMRDSSRQTPRAFTQLGARAPEKREIVSVKLSNRVERKI